MRCFEVHIVRFSVSEDGGPFVPDDHFTSCADDGAWDILASILAPYHMPLHWLLDAINFGNAKAPWAIACLDREYAIAGHIATTRHADADADADIKFLFYRICDGPLPEGVAPGVGALFFYGSRDGLELSAERSPVFAAVQDALKDCSPECSWLVFPDPLSQTWLDQILPGDRELWLTHQR